LPEEHREIEGNKLNEVAPALDIPGFVAFFNDDSNAPITIKHSRNSSQDSTA
jgi:hypothetical protein